MGAVSLHGCGFIFIQHAAGNDSLVNRSRSRAAARCGERLGPVSCPGRAEEKFWLFRCMGTVLSFCAVSRGEGVAVFVSGCGSFLQHVAGNVFLAFRSRARAVARRREQLWPGSCPGTCWGAEGHSCMTGDVPRDMLGSG